MTGPIVYVLCSLTSLICAIMLYRQFWRTKLRLLLWGSLCFSGFAISNMFLIMDRVIFPDINFSIIRTVPALVGVGILIFGFIWDAT